MVSAYGVEDIRRFGDAEVGVRLADGTTFRGVFRIELLSDQSVSVYIKSHGGSGATLYIDQIAEIMPLPAE